MASPSSTKVPGTFLGWAKNFANLCLSWIQARAGIPHHASDAAGAFNLYSADGFATSTPHRGDLVFFGRTNDNLQAGHVGIVDGHGGFTSVQGDGRIMNTPLQWWNDHSAPITGYVNVDNFGPGTRAKLIGLLPSESQTADTAGADTTIIKPITPPGQPGPTNPADIIKPLDFKLHCPPTPPAGDDNTPLLGGVKNLGQQAIYLAQYAICGVQAFWQAITTPGYWWRIGLTAVGLLLIVLGFLRLFKTDEASFLKHAVTG